MSDGKKFKPATIMIYSDQLSNTIILVAVHCHKTIYAKIFLSQNFRPTFPSDTKSQEITRW